jgi:site-specific recombinase XerD
MKPLKLSQVVTGYMINAYARQLSPHTISDYQNIINKFSAHLGKDYLMSEITSTHIGLFLGGHVGLKKKTILNYHTGLSALWNWAVSEGIVEENIVRRIKPPKPELRVITPYTLEEMKLMLASLERTISYTRPGQGLQDRAAAEPERARAIILFLIDTGVRAEELCGIKIGHVDKRLMRVKVFGKGAKDRYVSFSARTAQTLWRYLSTRPDAKESEYLFASRGSSGQLTRSRLLKMLVAIGNRAGVKGVNVHRFRHSFAIQYLRNRGDAYTLQRLLGHSTLEMVKRYLAIVQSDIEDAYKGASPVGNWNL